MLLFFAMVVVSGEFQYTVLLINVVSGEFQYTTTLRFPPPVQNALPEGSGCVSFVSGHIGVRVCDG